MRSQTTNGYYIIGNDYAALAISLADETDSHVFTLGDQAAYTQAVCCAKEGQPAQKHVYIVEAAIPKTLHDGMLFTDTEVRDRRLQELSVYLASQFPGEPTYILKKAGAIGVSMTEDQARKLTNHSMVKAVLRRRK